MRRATNAAALVQTEPRSPCHEFVVETCAHQEREQLIEHLTRRLNPSTWDLIRNGALSHVLYKMGDEPGFFAVLNAPSIEEANKIVASGVENLELFDLEVVPVNQFPHFA